MEEAEGVEGVVIVNLEEWQRELVEVALKFPDGTSSWFLTPARGASKDTQIINAAMAVAEHVSAHPDVSR